MSNYKSVLAISKIIRILYNSSALNSKGQFCNEWKYSCRNLVSELAYWTETENGVHFVCYLREAKKFCKFSENAWSSVQEKPDDTNLQKQKGGIHGEHIVPISLVKRIAFNMLKSGASDDQVINMFSHLVEVIFITRDEQKLLDSSVSRGGLGLRTSMPQRWDLNVVDCDWSQAKRYGRFDVAEIKFAQQTIGNSITEWNLHSSSYLRPVNENVRRKVETKRTLDA